MKLVYIESPYAPKDNVSTEEHLAYLHDICRWAVLNGYNPVASHGWYTQFLDDTVPDERTLGIAAGQKLSELCEERWFCVDYGVSKGMQYGYQYWHDKTPWQHLKIWKERALQDSSDLTLEALCDL